MASPNHPVDHDPNLNSVEPISTSIRAPVQYSRSISTFNDTSRPKLTIGRRSTRLGLIYEDTSRVAPRSNALERSKGIEEGRSTITQHDSLYLLKLKRDHSLPPLYHDSVSNYSTQSLSRLTSTPFSKSNHRSWTRLERGQEWERHLVEKRREHEKFCQLQERQAENQTRDCRSFWISMDRHEQDRQRKSSYSEKKMMDEIERAQLTLEQMKASEERKQEQISVNQKEFSERMEERRNQCERKFQARLNDRRERFENRLADRHARQLLQLQKLLDRVNEKKKERACMECKLEKEELDRNERCKAFQSFQYQSIPLP